MFDDPLIGTPGYLRGYSCQGLGAAEALDTLLSQQITNRTLAMMQAVTQTPFVPPTPMPPDDGQLHISIRKKQYKFNFND